MTGSYLRTAFLVTFYLYVFLAASLQGVQCEEVSGAEVQVDAESVPPEDLCRPYIEKALKHLGGAGSLEQTSAEEKEIVDETDQAEEETLTTASDEAEESPKDSDAPADESREDVNDDVDESKHDEEEQSQVPEAENERADDISEEASVDVTTIESSDSDNDDKDEAEESEQEQQQQDLPEDESVEGEDVEEHSEEHQEISNEQIVSEEQSDAAAAEDTDNETPEISVEEDVKSDDVVNDDETTSKESGEATEKETEEEGEEKDGEKGEGEEKDGEEGEAEEKDGEEGDGKEEEVEQEEEEEEEKGKEHEDKESNESTDGPEESKQHLAENVSEEAEEKEEDDKLSRARRDVESNEEEEKEEAAQEEDTNAESDEQEEETPTDAEDDQVASVDSGEEATTPEEDLIEEILPEIPENLRPRDHINQLLKLDEENEEKERAIEKVADVVLRDLKKLYDTAIQPLETLYKYRDLSNRHFGDPEIFSKPLILFMGPWSGGKSSIINYLLDIQYKATALRTGAEPSPAYFNILMYGKEEGVLDGTQLAADWTFSGLQKFGQGLLDRLRGLRLDNKLLEKVNIVEIPGILEIRKQVQRLFPFNDACQWFIDRADIIFLVYDPSKLDVGPETEAILDQLKGREYQTRIILNKADQVKPEELMRVQGALIWNISPLMSSAEPPIMYSTSLWSLPYEAGAPTRLLYAQERAFLRDLRTAIERRVEHKIASARRFAVRVRNHAKMVDCYLTTYYNHKTFFGNKKDISDKIIENPQDYHIYEGLSTLTNISRYDLPDPDVYRDFFRLNPLYDFQLLSSTCTYFRGCPINRLDVAIAYDLPELVGKYKKSVETVIQESETNNAQS